MAQAAQQAAMAQAAQQAAMAQAAQQAAMAVNAPGTLPLGGGVTGATA